MARSGLGSAAIVWAIAQASPCLAQSFGPTTILHLQAEGAVGVLPDRLIGELFAQGKAPSVAAAQRRVNGLMAAAMNEAQAHPEIQSRALAYSVAPADDRTPAWTAQQILELEAGDGSTLLDLVGRLQAQGFGVASISWRLSPALRSKAYDEAISKALQQIQQRAKTVAGTLGLAVDHIQDIRLDSPAFQPRPLMAMARSGVAAPQETAAPQTVVASLSADIVLRP